MRAQPTSRPIAVWRGMLPQVGTTTRRVAGCCGGKCATEDSFQFFAVSARGILALGVAAVARWEPPGPDAFAVSTTTHGALAFVFSALVALLNFFGEVLALAVRKGTPA